MGGRDLLMRSIFVIGVYRVSGSVMYKFHHVFSLSQKFQELSILLLAFTHCLLFCEQFFNLGVTVLIQDLVNLFLTEAKCAQ